MINTAKRFLRDVSGASGAEYAMIVAVVGLGMGAASLALGGNVGVAVDNGSGALYGMNDVPEDGTSSGGGGDSSISTTTGGDT